MKRIDSLCAQYPDVPRPIVIKMDLLVQGLRFTPLMLDIGQWAIPEYLTWDRENYEDAKQKNPLLGENWTWLPHSFTFKNEGITAKIFYDMLRGGQSPYEVREHEGGYWLFGEEEPLLEITFEKRPEWLSQRMDDGHQMASIFAHSSPDNLLGFPVRMCTYYKSDEICKFCCLNPVDKNIAKGDDYFDMIMSPEKAAQALSAAIDETDVRHVTLTGGALKNRSKEAQTYADIVRAMAEVRDRKRYDLTFRIMSTALDDESQELIKDAGADEICFNMEVFEESLWEEVVPGKLHHIGRDNWMDRLIRARDRFGRGRAATQFVIGMAKISGKFPNDEDAIAAELRGIEWCAENGIYPNTSTFFNTPGSVYEKEKAPSTEYFLTVAQERHKIMLKHDMYFDYDVPRNYTHNCRRCGYLSPDADFQWLQHTGSEDSSARVA